VKTLTLANMKGGTGKTSLAVSLAAELAKNDRTVLLDFDPQANTTVWTAPEDAKLAKIKGTAKQTIYTIPIDQVFFRAQNKSKTIQTMDAKPETLNEISRLANNIRGGE
jgi:cellulose biosynthesis protein BcsQ